MAMAAAVNFSVAAVRSMETTYQEDYTEALDQRITNYVGLMGYTILLWDHIITFGDEVNYIWPGRKGIYAWLFFINRYFTPVSFIGNLTAYFSSWSTETCRHFVRYEGACVCIAIEVTALMMLLRVKAIYSSQPLVVYFVAGILAAETVVNAWLLTSSGPVMHQSGSGVHACSMIFDPKLKAVPSLTAWIPLLYDTIVIVLTVWKCMGPVKHKTGGRVVRTLLQDGLLYYSVMFSVNFVLAVMIAAPPVQAGLKNVAAQLEQLLTVAMMSRISLNLKRQAFYESEIETEAVSSLHFSGRKNIVRRIPITTNYIGHTRHQRSHNRPESAGGLPLAFSSFIPSALSSPERAHFDEEEMYALRTLRTNRVS